jgi:hypothetical protein
MTFSAVYAVNLIMKPFFFAIFLYICHFFFIVVNTGYVVFVKQVRENPQNEITFEKTDKCV